LGADIGQELHTCSPTTSMRSSCSVSDRPDGRSYDGNDVHVLHMTDGKVTEFRGAHPGDEATSDAALAEPHPVPA
jgi:hypothetical protein